MLTVCNGGIYIPGDVISGLTVMQLGGQRPISNYMSWNDRTASCSFSGLGEIERVIILS